MTDVAESFEPEDHARVLYDKLFAQVYRPLFPAIQPHLKRLAQLHAETAEGGRS